MRESQSNFYKSWEEQMKAWRRARSDMQLYFGELKKRDSLREEYATLVDAVDMVVDLFKIGI